MTDVVVCVMVYPRDTVGMPADKARRAWTRGDIVSVDDDASLVGYPVLKTHANGAGSNRLRYIRVSGIPSDLATVRQVFTERLDHDADPTFLGANRWKGSSLILFTSWPEKYAELRDLGATSLTWAQVKTVLEDESGNKITDDDV